METIIEFFKSMTFWNWISLIGFLVLPFTALNLYFNLKPRYIDWRATKSKKAFDSRIKFLEEKLSEIEVLKKKPELFYIELIKNAVSSVIYFLLAFGYFSIAFFYNASPPIGFTKMIDIFNVAVMMVIAIIVFIAMFKLNRIRRLAQQFWSPESLAKEIFELINEAKRKELIPQDDNSTIETIIKKEIFSDEEKEVLKRLIINEI